MLQNTNIKTIFFDFDGTLIDHFTTVYKCFKYAHEQLGLPIIDRETVRTTVGESLEITVEKFVGKELVPQVVKHFREHFEKIMLDDVFLLEGAKWLLNSLHSKGYQLALFTNKPGPYARKITKHLDLDNCLHRVIGVHDHPSKKPEKDFTVFALSEMKSCSQTSILIGDSVFDIDAAQTVGMPCYIVTTGSHTKEEIESHKNPAQAIFENLYTLGETLFQLERPAALSV